MYKKNVRRWWWFMITVIGLAGCIQPTSETDLTRTAIAPYLPLTQAATPMVPTNPPVAVVTTPPPAVPTSPAGVTGSTPSPAQSLPLVGQFIQDRGDTPNNLVVWDERALGPDRVSGFSYTNTNGLPCTGYLLMTPGDGLWQLNNGALVCPSQAGAEALAAVTFFLTSDGQPYTITFGRVENTGVSAIAVIYTDNSSQTTSPVMGGFLVLQPGVVSVSVITAVNAQGNTVIPNIPQSPV